MAKKLINRLERNQNQQNSNVEPEVLRDYSVGAFLTDEENRTLWVNGMLYGNAYISFNEDGIVNTRQPKHAEVFNDFNDNKAEGHYSHAEGGTYVNTVYNNTKITYLETPKIIEENNDRYSYSYSVPYTSVLYKMIQVMANPVMNIPLYVVIKNEDRLDSQEVIETSNDIITNYDTENTLLAIDKYDKSEPITYEGTDSQLENKVTSNEPIKYYINGFKYVKTDNLVYFNVATSLDSEAESVKLPDYCVGKTMYFHYYYAYDGKDGWTEATRDGAHAEGVSQAHGVMSHTEGFANRSYEDYSHTEGVGNEVYGLAAHAEGDRNIVTNSAPYSHVEGHMNIAKADSVHVEGRNNLGNNTGAHVEGGRNIVNGIYGHAEGYGNIVNNDYGHAEGLGTKVTNAGEHAEGTYNVSAPNYISSIGIGTSDKDRKNALTVDKNGKIYLTKTIEDSDNTVIEYNPCLYDGVNITDDSKSLQRILAESEQKLVEISHSELLERVETGNLIPGQFYRIIDYVTTVKQNFYNVSSACNPFDIVVLALSKDTLSENAYAIHKNFNAFKNNIDYDIIDDNFYKKEFTFPLYEYTFNTESQTYERENTNNEIILDKYNDNIDISNTVVNLYKSSTASIPFYTLNNKYKKLLLLTDNTGKSNYIYNYISLENSLINTDIIPETNTNNNYNINSFLKLESMPSLGGAYVTSAFTKTFYIPGVLVYKIYENDSEYGYLTVGKDYNDVCNSLLNCNYTHLNSSFINNSILINKTNNTSTLSVRATYNIIRSNISIMPKLSEFSANVNRAFSNDYLSATAFVTVASSNFKSNNTSTYFVNFKRGDYNLYVLYNSELKSLNYQFDNGNILTDTLRDIKELDTSVYKDICNSLQNKNFVDDALLIYPTNKNWIEIAQIYGLNSNFTTISLEPMYFVMNPITSYNLSTESNEIRCNLTVDENNNLTYLFPNITKIIGYNPHIISNEYLLNIINYYTPTTNKVCNLQSWKLKYKITNDSEFVIPSYIPEYLVFNNYDNSTDDNILSNTISNYSKQKLNITNLTNNLDKNTNNWLINIDNNTDDKDLIDRILTYGYRWDQIDIQDNSIKTKGGYTILSNLIEPLSYNDTVYNADIFNIDKKTIINTKTEINAENKKYYKENLRLEHYKSCIINISDNTGNLTNILYNGVQSVQTDNSNFCTTDEYGQTFSSDSINYILINKTKKQSDDTYTLHNILDTQSNGILYANLTTVDNNTDDTQTTNCILYKYNRKGEYKKLIYNENNNNGDVIKIEYNNTLNVVNKITIKYKFDTGSGSQTLDLPFYIRLDENGNPVKYNNKLKLFECEGVINGENYDENDNYYVYECIIPNYIIDNDSDGTNAENNNSLIGINYENVNEYQSAFDILNDEFISLNGNESSIINYLRVNDLKYAYLNKYIIAKNITPADEGNTYISFETIGSIKTYDMYLINRSVPITLDENNINNINLLFTASEVNGSIINETPDYNEYNLIINNGICYDNLSIDYSKTYDLIYTDENVDIGTSGLIYNKYIYNTIYNDDILYTIYKNEDDTTKCIISNAFADNIFVSNNKIITNFYNEINTYNKNVISYCKYIGNNISIYTNNDTQVISEGDNDEQETETIYTQQPELNEYKYLEWVSKINNASKYIKRYKKEYFSKGYIYDIIDEFNNHLQYDFTNIQYTISGTLYYTFNITDESNNILDASFSGNIKNNNFYNINGIKQSNIFIAKENNLALLNNIFNNVNTLIINRDECNIENSNFSNITNINSIGDDTINISDSILSNLSNKVLSEENYNSRIIKNTLPAEMNTNKSIYPIFALNNLRVYNNTCSNVLAATGIYDVSNTITSITSPACEVSAQTETFSVNRSTGNISKGSWNSAYNTSSIVLSCKIPKSVDATTDTEGKCYKLINNKYIDLGYIMGYLYYYYSSAYNSGGNNANRPDLHHKFAPTIIVSGAINYNSGRFGIDREVWSNIPDEVGYGYLAAAHCAIDISNITLNNDTAKIISNGNNYYLITSTPMYVNILLTSDSYYSGAGNDNKTWGTDARIGNVVYTRNIDKSIKLNYLNVEIFRDKQSLYPNLTSNTTGQTHNVFAGVDLNIETYKYNLGSTDSLIAICNNGILIKNSNNNYSISNFIEGSNSSIIFTSTSVPKQ